MALSDMGNCTQTAVISTEHTLDTETTAGIYILHVDLTNMALGDVVELRAKAKVLTGGSSRLLYDATFGPNPPEAKVAQSLPLVSGFELIVTLKQVAGTGRNFDWTLWKVD
jgi:hypothetical protein